MKHQLYYPTNVPEQIIWLINFYLKLIGHAATLGVSTEVCAAAVADARWLVYLLGTYQPAYRAWAKANTDFIRAAQTGTGDAVMTLPAFVPPPLPVADPAPGGLPAVVAVKPGALSRIFSLIQVMQEAPAYDDAVATDLGTLGGEVTAPDMEIIQPLIKVRIIGGQVFIDWGWDGNRAFLEMIEIQVDRGDGQGFGFLANDTTPGYTDTHPLPAVLTKWKYRARYHANDGPVGLWSNVMEIVVVG